MGLGDQQSEYNSWYENSNQRQIDQAVFDEWWKRVYCQGEKLGIDFDQFYQNEANAAATRLNTFNEYSAAEQQRRARDAERQRFSQELNPAVASANEELRRNQEAAARNAVQLQHQAEAQQTNGELQRLVQKMSPSVNEYAMPETGAAYRNQEVKLVIGGTDYGSIPAQVYEYTPGSSSFTMPEKSSFDYIIDAFQNGKMDIGGYGVRIVDDTEQQKDRLRAKTAEFGSGMNFLLPWVGGGGLASIGSSSRTIGWMGQTAKGSSKAAEVIVKDPTQLLATQAERAAAQKAAEEASQIASKSGWVDEAGKVFWPTKSFTNTTPKTIELQPGTLFDRYGSSKGTWAAPAGTPYEMRALSPGTETTKYTVYEVVKPIKGLGGEVAPWFNQTGGGIQYKFEESISDLLRKGYIKEYIER